MCVCVGILREEKSKSKRVKRRMRLAKRETLELLKVLREQQLKADWYRILSRVAVGSNT